MWKTIYQLLKKYKAGLSNMSDEKVAVALFERLPSLGHDNAVILYVSDLRPDYLLTWKGASWAADTAGPGRQ